MRESRLELARRQAKLEEDLRIAELEELKHDPDFSAAYERLINFERERDSVRKRLAYLRPMYSSAIELVRDDPAGGYRDLLVEVTLAYSRTFKELQKIADAIGSWGQSFSANKAQGDVPVIVQKQLSHLSDGFSEEIDADAEIQRILEDFPEFQEKNLIENVSEDTLPPKPLNTTIEVPRPRIEVQDGGVVKLSAVREPYLEAKRQYRDIQHTLTEGERREFRSKLAVLASAVREAEDRHYNAFFADEISPVPAPTPAPSPMASFASAPMATPTLARSPMGGKVSGPVWRRVVSGLASSLKLNDE
jgi:hypothetical protein